jgi:diguanylate cyclase (GGDEF)-like protein
MQQFKHFNNTHGHQFGDEVLRDVARTVKNNTREIDVVAGYGGE